jgi:glycosyltransferase involved in cell wall biosynthesis
MRKHGYDKLVKQISFQREGDIKESCIKYGVEVARFATGERIDVVHVMSPVTHDVVFPASPQAPIVSTMYDLIPIVLNYNPRFYSDEIYADYLLKLTLMRRYSRRVVAISNNTKSDVTRLLEMPLDRIDVIYPSLDEWERVDSQGVKKITSRLGIAGKYLLYVGGWDPRKNIESLIVAYGRLPKELRESFSLVIDAELDAAAKSGFDRLVGSIAGEVILAGYVPHDYLAPLYQGAELLVVPSYYEGFSYPAVEAMHFGLPIAASNVSSLPEVAEDAALYFNPNDVDDMASCIRRLLESKSLRDELVEAGRLRLKHFESARAAQELLAAYRKVAKKQPKESKRRARIAFVTPMPPAKSGVARYAAELLPELNNYFDIDIYADTRMENNDSRKRFRGLEEYAASHDGYDFTIFQMGNSQAHDHIYNLMINYPGITILHDNNLHGFIYHRALVWRNEPHKYEMELAAQYGVKGLRLARIVESAGLSPETAHSNPLYFTTVISSNILVVTNDRVPPEFKDVWNTPVRPIPLGVKISASGEDERKKIRHQYDVPEDAFVVLTAGFIEPHGLQDRRIHLCLKAFRKLVLQNAKCKYIVAGLTKDARRDLQEWTKNLGLEKEVSLLEDSSETTFDNLNQLSDIRLELRHPCFAFTSGSILNSLARGKPVIASENSANETLPTLCVWKVKPEEPYEGELLYRFLDRLMKDSDLRLKMRRNALEYCAQRTWPEIAQRIRDAVLSSTNL